VNQENLFALQLSDSAGALQLRAQSRHANHTSRHAGGLYHDRAPERMADQHHAPPPLTLEPFKSDQHIEDARAELRGMTVGYFEREGAFFH
jgi:hypothetical protein